MSSKELPSDAVWLVTGCSTGIGAALAQRVLETPGHRIVATARNPSTLSFLPDDGARVLKLALDVTSAEAVPAAFGAALEAFGRIDVVVNNAGAILRAEAEALFAEEHVGLARDLFEINFWGAARVSREAVRVFREVNGPKTGGTLVQVTSLGGYIGSPGGSTYQASKFALEGFTEALAKEVSPAWNIRVLIAEPGAVRTPMMVGENAKRGPRLAAYADDPAGGYNRVLAYLSGPDVGAHWATPAAVAGALVGAVQGQAARPLPLRLPLGSDSWGMIRAETENILADLAQWEDVSCSVSDRAQLDSIAFLAKK